MPLDISLINSFLARFSHTGVLILVVEFKPRGVYSDTVFKIHHSIIRGFSVALLMIIGG